MRTFKQQRGASFLGILIFVAMFMAIGLFALKTGPLFMQNASVNKALDDLSSVPDIGKQGKKAIRDRVDGQLYIDAVDSFDARDLVIKKSTEKKVWLVTADYEAKRVLLKNVSVAVHFAKTVEVPR
jgi:hypothetical protein